MNLLAIPADAKTLKFWVSQNARDVWLGRMTTRQAVVQLMHVAHHLKCAKEYTPATMLFLLDRAIEKHDADYTMVEYQVSRLVDQLLDARQSGAEIKAQVVRMAMRNDCGDLDFDHVIRERLRRFASPARQRTG